MRRGGMANKYCDLPRLGHDTCDVPVIPFGVHLVVSACGRRIASDREAYCTPPPTASPNQDRRYEAAYR